MNKIEKFKSFEKFILEENHSKSETIAKVVNKIKAEYGVTPEKFVETARERGPAELEKYIVRILKPYLEQKETHDKNGKFQFDYDGLLTGLVSWSIIQLELNRNPKTIE